MSSSPLPQPLRLSPLQQWQLVSQPRRFTDWLRPRYGGLANLQIRGQPYVVVLSAAGARDALSADWLGYDAFFKESFVDLGGPGALWVLGAEAHKRERQLVAPGFHARGFHRFGTAIQEIARAQHARWQPGQRIRALDSTLSISLDVILQVVFGVEDTALMREGRALISALLGSVHPLIVFMPELQRRWVPHWAKFERARGAFLAWVNRYLAYRRAEGAERDDVLGHLLAARYADGSPIRDADIRDQLVTILLAGHETTATALAWALYELGRHPAVLARLRAEVESAGSHAARDVIARLPYLAAVCNETLRLHTLLAEVPRLCVAPHECLGYTIPAGHAISVSIMAIHHDPALYPQPDAFRPERFLEQSYTAFEFLPFGGGDRRCLGAGLSDYEMRIALAEIATHWELEPAAMEVKIRHDIAMGPKRGMPLNLIQRRRPAREVVTNVRHALAA